MINYHDILSDIADGEYRRLAQSHKLSVGLLGGDLGPIIYLYMYSRLDSTYLSKADNMLDKLLLSFKSSCPSSTYCNGAGGMIVGLYSLNHEGFIADFSHLMGAIDQYVSQSLDEMFSNNNHDFLHGFIGLGFYWIRRYKCNCPIAVEQLERILEHLQSSAEVVNDVVKWPRKEGKWVKRYNISLSHGYSSTIILLTRMLRVTELKDKHRRLIKQLLEGAVNYILLNRLDVEKYGCWFTTSSIECDVPSRSRLAWCYGDLGVAIALYRAGCALEKDDLIALARAILEYSAKCRRNLMQNYIYDTCVCHGAAGVGLIFREMSKVFSSDSMAKAANYWREVVIRNAVKRNNRYFFPFYDARDSRLDENYGLLDGSAGVGLYLLNELGSSPLASYLLISDEPE